VNHGRPRRAAGTTHWRRCSMGLWRIREGDIAAAYSVSTFPKVSVFVHEGRWFTNGGANYSKWIRAELNGQRAVTRRLFRD